MWRVVSIIGMVFLYGCGSSEQCSTSISPTPLTLSVSRIESALCGVASVEEVEHLFEKHRAFSTYFLDIEEYPSATLLAEKVYTLFQEPSIDTLCNEAKEAFQNFEQTVETLEKAIGRLKTYYPQVPAPRIQTAVTGLYKDLYISDTLIIIGMDFFIGTNASYEPMTIPKYMLRRYNIEHLPSHIMHVLSSQFISESEGETLLSEMIDFGKLYYLQSKILPCTPARILMGYTEEEWNDSFENDHIIWANFIENEILYETNHQIKQKFLGERPNVYEIGEKCPGRIGRWLGWQIVNSYMQRNDVSVVELMQEQDARLIFRKSRYKPSAR